MKAIINQKTCLGCALCEKICPAVFRMEEERAIPYLDSIPEKFMITTNTALESCPVNAIFIK